jgi:hypothetical protein
MKTTTYSCQLISTDETYDQALQALKTSRIENTHSLWRYVLHDYLIIRYVTAYINHGSEEYSS